MQECGFCNFQNEDSDKSCFNCGRGLGKQGDMAMAMGQGMPPVSHAATTQAVAPPPPAGTAPGGNPAPQPYFSVSERITSPVGTGAYALPAQPAAPSPTAVVGQAVPPLPQDLYASRSTLAFPDPRMVVPRPAFSYATFSHRLTAWAIDYTLVMGVAFVLFGMMGYGGIFLFANPFIFYGIFFVGPLYNGLMVGLLGCTLGKWVLNLKVLRSDGEPVGMGHAFLRETIGKWAAGCFFGMGYYTIISDARSQGWHDKIASTIVVNYNFHKHGIEGR